MARSAIIVSDNFLASEALETIVADFFKVEMISPTHLSDQYLQRHLLVLIDVNLSSTDFEPQMALLLQARARVCDLAFVLRRNDKSEREQAISIDENVHLVKRNVPTSIRALMLKLTKADEGDPIGSAFETSATFEGGILVQDRLLDSVVRGQSLPKEQIEHSTKQIAASVNVNTIAPWLDTVRAHHSYTYRHSLTVSGLAAAFARHLGMNNKDVELLTLGGLVHDIGKLRIPLDILDKPGPPTEMELNLLRSHPGSGAEILRADGQFDKRLIDIALHHHEFNDGTGYPDGLTCDEISDPVRITTIVDIFSALIEERSYKPAMDGEKAFDILLGMDEKLERCIVEVFEPIALRIHSPCHDQR